MTIYEELLNVAKTTSVQLVMNGTKEEFLRSLLLAVSRVSDEVWKTLSHPAQQWFNDAATALSLEKPLPILQGYEQSGKSTIVQAPPIIKQAKAHRVSGVIDDIRRIVILHPDWTTRRVHEFLVERYPDLTLGVVSTNIGDIRHIIRLAREMGFWNDETYKTTQD